MNVSRTGYLVRAALRAMTLLCVAAVCATPLSARLVIDGAVVDSTTSAPMPQATIRVVGTGTSTLVNNDGRFRLVLNDGKYVIKVTHVACYSDSVEVSGSDTTVTVRFVLRPSPILLRGVTVGPRQYDPAQQIIRAAIKRKKDILSRLHDYTCDAYTRVAVRDDAKKDSGLFLITETQTTCYWQQPNRYKEIITARRQTANIKAQDNLVSLGEVLNFNQNRLDLGRYAIVSPVATDALDHYDYYLLDTILVDNRRVFRLDVEPRSQITPLFVGQIQIADSSYDVVAVDVGFNAAVSFNILKNPRYVQRLASFGPDLWMPVEIKFTGDVKFDIPLPGIPQKMSFVMVASVSDYTFDKGVPKGTFDEYAVVVAPTADVKDTARWQAAQVIPLTSEEQTAYHRIDSTERAPKPILKQAAMVLPVALFLTTFGAEDLFRFNRVEGAYAGIGVRPEFGKLSTHLAGGYAFSAKRWEGEASASYKLNSTGWTVGGSIRDRIVRRPAMITGPDVNTTYYALWQKDDPLDYYRERGFSLWSEIKPINHTRLRVGLRDFTQSTQTVNTEFSIFRRNRQPRENPTINDGEKRSSFCSFVYDSRKRIKTGRRDQIDFSFNFIRLSLQGEWSSPEILNSDFCFGRYTGELEWQFRGVVPGLTTLWSSAGTTDGCPPVQSLFVVDHGSGGLFGRHGFVTLNENNFVGTSAAAVTLEHDFGRRSLSLTHIGFLSKLPFSLSVRGGVFWTGYKYRQTPANSSLRIARKEYSEIGFGVGNLTPFLSPFNFQVWFDWQLSAYDTERFSLGINLGM